MIRAKPSRCTLTVGERRKRTWANPKKKTASGKPYSMPTTHAEKKKLKLTNKNISPPPPSLLSCSVWKGRRRRSHFNAIQRKSVA